MDRGGGHGGRPWSCGARTGGGGHRSRHAPARGRGPGGDGAHRLPRRAGGAVLPPAARGGRPARRARAGRRGDHRLRPAVAPVPRRRPVQPARLAALPRGADRRRQRAARGDRPARHVRAQLAHAGRRAARRQGRAAAPRAAARTAHRGAHPGRDAVIQGTNTSDDLAQDARGRLHAAWTSTSGHNHCVVYARTRVKRRSWFGASTTLFKSHSFATSPISVHIAAAPDGRGVAVWQDEGASSAQVLHVRAATLRQKRGKARFIRNPFHRPACPRG
jgi:hypothetical protein